MLWKRYLLNFALNTIFCLFIAVLVIRQNLSPNYHQALTVSLCIGWCIQLTFVVFDRFVFTQSPGYLVGLVQSVIGLLVGISLGGALISGDVLVLSFDLWTSEVLLFSLFFAVLGGSVFVTSVRLNEQNKKIREFETNQLRQEAKLLETKFQFLQAQIEPHFLFNTLSNITSLIPAEPLLAEKSLINLTELLRVKFDGSQDKVSTLADELWLIRTYLDLHSIRLGKRFKFEIVIKKSAENFDLASINIPSLLIQPLVENAIQHGIEPSILGGSIKVLVDIESNKVCVNVIDTGIGIKQPNNASMTSHAGIGLSSIRARLSAIYGENASLKITENKDAGVTATLIILREVPE
mgnify:FL=1|tara:strand:- start:813 stop:1865 length:1053 start_codon:yes stop_codon:yes gene_type:complete